MSIKVPLMTRTRIAVGSWFLNHSVSMAAGGYKGLQGNIRQLARPIVESVPKRVKRIQFDKVNFDTPEALENEVLAIMSATIHGDYASNYYPIIRPTKDYLRKYGITSDNPCMAFLQVFFVTLKDIFKVIWSRNIENAAITTKWVRLTAGQIARKYNYNKGKRRIEDEATKWYHVETGQYISYAEYKSLEGVEQSFYERGPAVSDDDFYRLAPKESKDVQQLPDSNTSAHTDRTENKILYQQLKDVFNNQMQEVDRLIISIHLQHQKDGISFEAAITRVLPQFRKHNITTVRGVKKRHAGLVHRYPILKHIGEAMKN